MTRVAQVALHRNILASNQNNLARANKLAQQLASGKRLQRISDDPIGGKRALGYRIKESEFGRYIDNIDQASSFLEVADTTLSDMTVLLDEVKALAVRGASGTEDADTRAAMARSVNALLERMVDSANATHDGRYLFAGTDVHTRPFSLSGDGSRVDYHGNLDTFSVAISPTAQARVNENGYAVFKQELDVFAVAVELRDALEDDDPAGADRLLERIDAAHAHVNQALGGLGGREQRLELARSRMEQAELNVKDLRSGEEDVDMTETIMEMQMAETALQAGLNAGSRVIQPSLLDFLA